MENHDPHGLGLLVERLRQQRWWWGRDPFAFVTVFAVALDTLSADAAIGFSALSTFNTLGAATFRTTASLATQAQPAVGGRGRIRQQRFAGEE